MQECVGEWGPLVTAGRMCSLMALVSFPVDKVQFEAPLRKETEAHSEMVSISLARRHVDSLAVTLPASPVAHLDSSLPEGAEPAPPSGGDSLTCVLCRSAGRDQGQ